MRKWVHNNPQLVAGMILIYLLAQLFSLHFHFEHVEQNHQVHVHSPFQSNHVETVHGHDVAPDLVLHESSHEHGEESSGELLGSFGKKLSSFALAILFSLFLILPFYYFKQLCKAIQFTLQWRDIHYLTPPLRAPPL